MSERLSDSQRTGSWTCTFKTGAAVFGFGGAEGRGSQPASVNNSAPALQHARAVLMHEEERDMASLSLSKKSAEPSRAEPRHR
ncbi:MAG: hypothetical protein ABIW85_10755 [Variovorax sp.]